MNTMPEFQTPAKSHAAPKPVEHEDLMQQHLRDENLAEPTPQDWLMLGAIIVIRTVISYSLNAELKSEPMVEAK